MTPDPLVEISGLRFAYGERQVLRGIDLTIPRGKIVAILGTSGSGKTTLLRLLSGQLKPAAGHVKVEGRVVHDMNDETLYAMRRKMGMQFQVSGLFSDLPVFDNIAFPLRELTELPEYMIRDLVLMKLDAVGLRNARHLMPSELSGGMQRRVALARAIALDPMLIMYDEPFSGLDPISLNAVSTLIRRLNDALGVTSIVVTYDVVESLKAVDYIYFISEGVVAAHGTVAEVNESREPFVRQFVDSLPDGPVAFHYPAPPLAADLRVGG
ncbi:MAG: ABC transporter ATP-binding protein [Burkholderiales bacterium]|nr:ABC transporter ATP-binding protein [Burkholderiales bacterium]